ncbi:MurR/RpiR family transcriptional regulator [Scatolibacter rhodanostii]|uniref:MurR/RpiR family transcriptional regulator n=1 Tax=Scatolibacter rhodanostii TaxID=2014781 RepID=UPI000C075C64|nr:MurR/RpiR family transcriptional regulator [Scatolibacter rhodanostii]
MNSQLSEKIHQYSATFSKGQKQIARYIEEYPDRVAFMTAAKLGLTVGVSESTVVRFATEIGYSGYPALQQAMQEMIRSKLTSLQRLRMSMEQFDREKILEAVLDKDSAIVKRTKENMDQEAFYEAVKALVGVKKVYILGAGSSLALATFLSHYCELIYDNVHLIDATGEARIYQQMISADKDDAIIAMSFPRYSKKAVKALDFAQNLGAVTIAITDSESSPLVKHASHVLLAKSEMVSFVDSLVGPLSLINALIVALAMEKQAEVAEKLDRIERIWDEYGVYEKVDEKINDEE